VQKLTLIFKRQAYVKESRYQELRRKTTRQSINNHTENMSDKIGSDSAALSRPASNEEHDEDDEDGESVEGNGDNRRLGHRGSRKRQKITPTAYRLHGNSMSDNMNSDTINVRTPASQQLSGPLGDGVPGTLPQSVATDEDNGQWGHGPVNNLSEQQDTRDTEYIPDVYSISDSTPSEIGCDITDIPDPGALSRSLGQISEERPANESVSRKHSPKIKFFPRKASGAIDFQGPLPSIKDITVGEYFQTYSEVSASPFSSLQSLTFDIKFKNGTAALEINKDSDETCWLELKTRISDLYKASKLKNPQETQFDVWVYPSGTENEIRDNEDLAGL
jgi:hypothetical protein